MFLIDNGQLTNDNGFHCDHKKRSPLRVFFLRNGL
jgi:hypothetical protein